MGLFNHWPYTNIHEMNLDWILEEIKKLIAEYTRLDESNKELQTNFDDLKEYVITYFDNLDLQEEVNTFFNHLIETGQLDQIILDAFNHLETRVDDLDAAIDDLEILVNTKVDAATNMIDAPVTLRVGTIKTKIFPSSGHIPQNVCNNPVRGYKTYLTGTVSGNTYIGDLSSDNITPRNLNTLTQLEHANDITMNTNNNKLYIADFTTTVKVVNAGSFEYEGTLTIEGVTLPIRGVEYYDNKLYFTTAGENSPTYTAEYGYYDFETETSRIVRIQSDIYSEIGSQNTITQQGMFIYKGIPYQIIDTISINGNYSGTVYYQIDLENAKVRPAFRLNHIGESEGCVVIDKEKILQYTPLTSNIGSVMELVPYGADTLTSTRFYVDGNATEIGIGTQASPFNSITNALYQAHYCENSPRVEIVLLSNVTEDVIFPEITLPVIYLNGSNFTLTTTAGRDIYNLNMRIYNITLDKTGGWNFYNCRIDMRKTNVIARDAATKFLASINTIIMADEIAVTFDVNWSVLFRNSGGWIYARITGVTSSTVNSYILLASAGASYIAGSKGTLTAPFRLEANAFGENKLT